MRILTVSAGLLLASACTAPEPASDPAADPDTPVSSAGSPAAVPTPTPMPTPTPTQPGTSAQVATLEGEWRIAAIDGADFNEDYALTLSATGDTLRFDPSCAGPNRNYDIDGHRFRAWVSEKDKMKAICEIGLPEGLTRMWRAIDAAGRIERTPSNGVLLSGGGHSLLLFSQ